jgi:ankyrin
MGNRVAVSPIVTVEPRRRKFHKPITLTIPLPQAATKGMINQYNGDAPTLRLLCSITGGLTKAQWEDVTGSTPLSFVNNCVSFTTTVSARFWLIDARQINESTRMATEIYREAIHVPFMAKFVVFARKHDPNEAQLRAFCMTDDKEDKTLESQEKFEEIAKSRDVEVLEGKPHFVEFAGNLAPVMKSGEQLNLTFQAFRENRLPFLVKVRDSNQEAIGRIAFMRDPRRSKTDPPQAPLCNLNLKLPDKIIESTTTSRRSTPSPYHRKSFGSSNFAGGILQPSLSSSSAVGSVGNGAVGKTPTDDTWKGGVTGMENVDFVGMSRDISSDWLPLAHELDIPTKEVSKITSDARNQANPSAQCLSLFESWQSQLKKHPKQESNAKSILEKALRSVQRDDLVSKYLKPPPAPSRVKRGVADSLERAIDAVGRDRDQEGFDSLRDELGSRGASLPPPPTTTDINLDVTLEDKDIMKVRASCMYSGYTDEIPFCVNPFFS